MAELSTSHYLGINDFIPRYKDACDCVPTQNYYHKASSIIIMIGNIIIAKMSIFSFLITIEQLVLTCFLSNFQKNHRLSSIGEFRAAKYK